MFSFIIRRSRKLAFPRSTKDRRSNTKRLPTAARPRLRTSRFNARAARQRALGRDPGVELPRRPKTEFTRQEWAPLLRIRIGRRMRLFDCSNLFDPFFNRHDIRRLQIAARPHVDDPFDSGQTARRQGLCRIVPARPSASSAARSQAKNYRSGFAWLHEGILACPLETERLRPDQDGWIDRAATRLIDARARRGRSRQMPAGARR